MLVSGRVMIQHFGESITPFSQKYMENPQKILAAPISMDVFFQFFFLPKKPRAPSWLNHWAHSSPGWWWMRLMHGWMHRRPGDAGEALIMGIYPPNATPPRKSRPL